MKKHFFLPRYAPFWCIPRYQVLTSILFLLLAVCFQTISEESLLNPSSLPPLPKKIIFTFDDGPYPEFTEKLLKILGEEKIKATFFIVGEMGARYPYLLKLLNSQGHEIAGHTYTHPNLTKIPLTRVKEELEKTRLLIREFTGKNTYLFRPPGGNYNESLKRISSSSGYQPIFWTIFPQDHSSDISAEEIYQRVIENIHPNGIILFHSGRENTLQALPRIVQTLKEKNYTFITISDLITEEKNLAYVQRTNPGY